MTILKHQFVEFIPDKIEAETIYISMAYCTAIHKCVCGCGNEVVTPISPTDWSLTFHGDSISLYPSIGNWNFDCNSHYWIINNRVKWSTKWSRAKIEKGREKDRLIKKNFYKRRKS